MNYKYFFNLCLITKKIFVGCLICIDRCCHGKRGCAEGIWRRCVGRGGREPQTELEAARGVWVRAALRRTRREEKPSRTWSGTTPACAYGGIAYMRICVGHGGREGELGAACGVCVRRYSVRANGIGIG